MPDLFLDQTRALRTKRRAARIVIYNPTSDSGEEKSVNYYQEDVLVDDQGRTISTSRAEDLVVMLRELATTVHSILDPVTGKTFDVSGAAVALWIETDYTARAAAQIASLNP